MEYSQLKNKTKQNKTMDYQAVQRHGWILNPYCKVKGVSVKILQTAWFHLYDILEKEKLQR